MRVKSNVRKSVSTKHVVGNSSASVNHAGETKKQAAQAVCFFLVRMG
jgi:hypothetical protein